MKLGPNRWSHQLTLRRQKRVGFGYIWKGIITLGALYCILHYIFRTFQMEMQLESTRQMEMQMQSHVDERDEAFELSKRLSGKNEIETQSGSTSKVLDVSNKRNFEALLERHRLRLDLFTPSDLDAIKKDVDELFHLKNQYSLMEANLEAELAQLKHDIVPKNHAE